MDDAIEAVRDASGVHDEKTAALHSAAGMAIFPVIEMPVPGKAVQRFR